MKPFDLQTLLEQPEQLRRRLILAIALDPPKQLKVRPKPATQPVKTKA